MKYFLTIIIAIQIGTIALVSTKDNKNQTLGFQVDQASTGIYRAPSQSGNLDNIKTYAGVLDTVVITGASTGVINFYDATTTNASLRFPQATSSQKVIAQIPASAAAQPYHFNVAFSQGLISEVIGSTPTSTITYR